MNVLRLTTLALMLLSVTIVGLPMKIFATPSETPIALFKNGKKVINYKQLVSELSSGDFVQFSNGSVIKLGAFLGEGGAERIFAISETKAIRLGKYDRNHEIPDYLRGEPILRKLGVRIVNVYTSESTPEYIIVDLRDGETMQYFLENLDSYSSEEIENRFDDLIQLAKTTAEFVMISDFFPKNIIWSKNEWVIIDWDYNHRLLSEDPDTTRDAFTWWEEAKISLPDWVYSKIHSEIKNIRSSLNLCQASLKTPQKPKWRFW